MSSLNLLPARVPFVDANGLLTMEAQKFFQSLFARAGGTTSIGLNDVAVMDSFDGSSATIAALQQEIAELRAEMSAIAAQTAQVAAVKSYANGLEVAAIFAPSSPTLWETPGRIGYFKPNTGQFTTVQLAASGTPSLFFGSDTTSGLYSSGAGSVSVSASGSAVWIWTSAGASTSQQITSTLPSGTPPFSIASATKVPNLYVERAGLADYAYTAGVADSLSSPSSYPADATDLPTCIALANALKSAALSKGL